MLVFCQFIAVEPVRPSLLKFIWNRISKCFRNPNYKYLGSKFKLTFCNSLTIWLQAVDDSEGPVVRAVANSLMDMERMKSGSCEVLVERLLQRLARLHSFSHFLLFAIWDKICFKLCLIGFLFMENAQDYSVFVIISIFCIYIFHV